MRLGYACLCICLSMPFCRSGEDSFSGQLGAEMLGMNCIRLCSVTFSANRNRKAPRAYGESLQFIFILNDPLGASEALSTTLRPTESLTKPLPLRAAQLSLMPSQHPQAKSSQLLPWPSQLPQSPAVLFIASEAPLKRSLPPFLMDFV